MDFDFPRKKEIIKLMVNQEKLRNLLCYGKEKELAKIKEAIDNISKIKEIITKELGEELWDKVNYYLTCMILFLN